MSPPFYEQRPPNALDIDSQIPVTNGAAPIPMGTAAASNMTLLKFASPPSLASSVSLSVTSSLASPPDSYDIHLPTSPHHSSVPHKIDSLELCPESLHSEKSATLPLPIPPQSRSPGILERTWSASSAYSYASSHTYSVSMTNATGILSSTPSVASSVLYHGFGGLYQSTQPTCEEFLLSTTAFGVITGVRNGPSTSSRHLDDLMRHSDDICGSYRHGGDTIIPASQIALQAHDAVGQPVFRYVHNADMPVFCRALSRATREVSRCAVRWSPNVDHNNCPIDTNKTTSGVKTCVDEEDREPRWYWVWFTIRRVGDQMVCVIRRPLNLGGDSEDEMSSADKKAAQRRRRNTYGGGLSGLVLSLILPDDDSESDSESDASMTYKEQVLGLSTDWRSSPTTATSTTEAPASFTSAHSTPRHKRKAQTQSKGGSSSDRSATNKETPPSSLFGALVSWAGATVGDVMFGAVSRYATDLFRRRDDQR
jgi:hypothetical protein